MLPVCVPLGQRETAWKGVDSLGLPDKNVGLVFAVAGNPSIIRLWIYGLECLHACECDPSFCRTILGVWKRRQAMNLGWQSLYSYILVQKPGVSENSDYEPGPQCCYEW